MILFVKAFDLGTEGVFGDNGDSTDCPSTTGDCTRSWKYEDDIALVKLRSKTEEAYYHNFDPKIKRQKKL